MKKEKAITLIALIITIIILLILAGVSIAALSGRGIFANANKAKLETKRAQIEEWLKLKVMEEQINNPTGTSQEIIPKVRDNVDNNKSELLKMGKNVAVDANVTTEEDGNVCFYVTVDGDKYKVGLNEQKFIGTDDDKTEDVPTAEGIITFSDEKWSNGKASVKINLKDDYKDKYQMQYQINSIEGNWTEIESGTTVSKLSNGDKVYVRLWNGTKGGEYAVNNILDNIAPSATINLSSSSTTVNTAITVLIRSTDAQSGVNISKCKWVYNQTAEKIGTNEENYTEGVIPTAQNIQRISLNIKTAGTYYLHLLIVDNAGNAAEIISGEIEIKSEKTALDDAESAKPSGATIIEKDTTKGIVMVDSKNNEWVWVEVPRNIFTTAKSASEYDNIKADLIEYAKDYREGSAGQGCNWTDEWHNGCGIAYTEYTAMYNKMLSSVYTNGGFWISRYEAGINGSDTNTDLGRTSSSSRITNKTISTLPSAVSKANMIPYNWVYCSEAQALASAMSTDSNKTSGLLFGIQWDLVCKYLEVKGKLSVEQIKGGDNVGSKNWGNYYNATVTAIKNGAKQRPSKTGIWISSTEDKTSESNILLTTGASEYTKKMNIYDFAGNETEWTLEKTSKESFPFAMRGGAFDQGSGYFPASNREYIGMTYAQGSVSFRSTLY